jgi:hypothetical protein
MAAERRGAAVIGHPVAHSRSPQMQTAGFRAIGLDWEYAAIDVPPEGLSGFLAGLAGSGLAGVNVTIPHKQAVIDACDTLSAEARAAGSVNTIVVGGECGLQGHSTDGAGRPPTPWCWAPAAPRGRWSLRSAARAGASAWRPAGPRRLPTWARGSSPGRPTAQPRWS